MNRRRSLILASVVGGTLFTGGAALALNVAAAPPGASTPSIDAGQWSLVDDTQEASTTQPTWVLLQEPAPEIATTTTSAPPAPDTSVAPTSPPATADDHGGRGDDGEQRGATRTTVEHRQPRHHDEDEAEHEQEHEQEHEHEPGDD